MMDRVFGKRTAPVVLEKDIVFPDSEGAKGNAVVGRLPREGLSWMVMEVSHPAFGQEVILSDVAVCVGDDALDIVSGIPVHMRLVTTIGISSARDSCLEDTRFALQKIGFVIGPTDIKNDKIGTPGDNDLAARWKTVVDGELNGIAENSDVLAEEQEGDVEDIIDARVMPPLHDRQGRRHRESRDVVSDCYDCYYDDLAVSGRGNGILTGVEVCENMLLTGGDPLLRLTNFSTLKRIQFEDADSMQLEAWCRVLYYAGQYDQLNIGGNAWKKCAVRYNRTLMLTRIPVTCRGKTRSIIRPV
jgi:hypothetical protein